MKKKLISLLLVFSFLLNTVPMAFAIEDGTEQTEDTTVSLVDQIGEDDANTEGDTDVAAPETTGEEQTDGADVSEDTDAAEAGDEGDDETQTNVLMALASQPAARSTVTLGSAADAAGRGLRQDRRSGRRGRHGHQRRLLQHGHRRAHGLLDHGGQRDQDLLRAVFCDPDGRHRGHP